MKIVMLSIAILLTFDVYATEFHSKPTCWPDGRFVHESFNEKYEERITIERVEYEKFENLMHSPNRGYWIHAVEPKVTNTPDNEAVTFIFNERDYLIKIRATDVVVLSLPRWINEKLLQLEFWWGRKLATQMIYDVEAEKIVWREMYLDGWDAYNQTKGACSMEIWIRDEKCKCVLPGS